ncbi:hypothetical protein [Veronia pacifica]|nr:hypothetical protein [Veronia pacifica]
MDSENSHEILDFCHVKYEVMEVILKKAKDIINEGSLEPVCNEKEVI